MIGIGADTDSGINIIGYFDDIEGLEGEYPLEKRVEGYPRKCKLILKGGINFFDFEDRLKKEFTENDNGGYFCVLDNQNNIKLAYFFYDLKIINKQELNTTLFHTEISCFLYEASKGVSDVWKSRINKNITEYNLWEKLDKKKRQGWLEVALHFQHITEDKENLKITLDGKLVDDEDSFFCALGESINGPGGYFGRGYDSLHDCLRGDFGIKLPFTLIWKNHLKSKEKLQKKFNTIVRLLKLDDVSVILD
ncbi:barstar family protein [Flavobacterium ustbae]|uniref:barstar family protein n=1 Tax=Flavobacterium ustbae TaxID=2488790 RepID=UPI000F77FCEB|nr:barstar family protein [Flavobacterium ustbae]